MLWHSGELHILAPLVLLFICVPDAYEKSARIKSDNTSMLLTGVVNVVATTYGKIV